MAKLSDAVPISEMGQRKLVVLWGRSNTGKTEFGSTWPKPLLYLRFGDDGSNTISTHTGVKGISVESCADCKSLFDEIIQKKGGGYKTVFLDTFSMFTNMWIAENVTNKKKKMTQQLWGDLKTETEELIKKAHEAALYCWTLLSCHETVDVIEGMEEEILPDARPNTTRGARSYLEGMANYGFHTTRLKREIVEDGKEKTVVKYAIHIGPNPYYWTKLQTPKELKRPAIMINPSFAKLEKLGLMGVSE